MFAFFIIFQVTFFFGVKNKPQISIKFREEFGWAFVGIFVKGSHVFDTTDSLLNLDRIID